MGEYLSYRAAIEGVPRVQARGRLDEVCERTMITDVRHQIIGTLSKGYRQRVGLAAALIHQPPVLILDEPTVGLDPRQIVKIRELIVMLGQDHTIILSTHILPEVEQICRRVLIIDGGHIVADGTPEQLRAGLQGAAELKVELEAPEDDARAALGSLPGVTEVQLEGGGRFMVAVEGGLDLRRAVFSPGRGARLGAPRDDADHAVPGGGVPAPHHPRRGRRDAGGAGRRDRGGGGQCVRPGRSCGAS